MAARAAGSTPGRGQAPPRLTLGERFGFPGNPRPHSWKPDHRKKRRRGITDNGAALEQQRRAVARADAALGSIAGPPAADTNGASAEDLQLSQERRRERDRATERRAKENGAADTAAFAGAAWWDVASPSGQDIESATSLDAIRRARPLPTQHRPINRFDELTQLIDEPDVELKRAAGTAGQRRLGALDPAQPAEICPVARANRDAAAQQHRRRH